jgi:hypothetical protein
VHEVDGAVDGLDPGLATAKLVVEAGVLVEELEPLERGREVLVGGGERLADLVGDRALGALALVIRPVEDVPFGGLKLAGGLEDHLNDVLDALDGRRVAVRLGGDDVDDAMGKLLHGRGRGPVEGGEAAREGVFDPLDVERDDASVALNDARRGHDFDL